MFNPTIGFIFQLGGLIVWFVGGTSRCIRRTRLTLGPLMAVPRLPVDVLPAADAA